VGVHASTLLSFWASLSGSVAFLGGVSAELAIVVFFLGVFFLKYG
jgi:hypothetical protein